MDRAALETLLKSTHLPVVYHHFVTPPKPPYIIYLFALSNNFGADNKVYDKADRYQVELYTAKKDSASEATLEAVLDAAETYWDKTETYIESEKLYQIIYEITI